MLLPLPAFLKRRIAGHNGDDHGSAASVGGHAATLAQLSTAAASYAEPAMHWGKAVGKAAAVAAAVVGAYIAAHDTGLIGGGVPRDQQPAAIGRPASPGGRRLGRGAEHPPGRQRHDHRRLDRSGEGIRRAAPRVLDRRAGGAGSGSGSQPSSSPAGDDPVKAATGTKLPSADDNPVSKTLRKVTKPGSRGVPVEDADAALDSRYRRSRSPRSRCPRYRSRRSRCLRVFPIRAELSAAQPGRSTTPPARPTGAVNGATGAATGTVNGATGAVGGAVNGTVGGVTGGGGILGGGRASPHPMAARFSRR